jgi:hypothetical protein
LLYQLSYRVESPCKINGKSIHVSADGAGSRSTP